MEKKTLVLIDGHALAYRAHFALLSRGFTTKDGVPTWAVFGFTKILLEVIEKLKPELFAVCFDCGKPTFRHEAYTEYKAHRKPMPDGLREQIDLIREVVRAFGIPVYELPGYEADDVIGTIARQAENAGYCVRIVTGDRDALQLVDENVAVLLPESGAGDLKKFGPEEVVEKYGLTPSQIVDYKALRGDPSDNIPGVPGIGEKTATKLLQEFGDFEKLYSDLEKVEPPRIREKLRENKEIAEKSRFLAAIDTEVPLEGLDWIHCELSMPDLGRLTELLTSLEFTTILRQLPKTLANFCGPSEKSEVPEQAEIRDQKSLDLNFSIVRSEGDLASLEEKLKKGEIFAFDVETDSLRSLDTKLVGLSLAMGGETATSCDSFYVPVGHQEGEQLPIGVVLSRLRLFLEDKNHPKVAHHAKFDVNVLSQYGIKVQGLAFDTMVADYLIHAGREGHGLKDLAWSVLSYKMTPISELIGSGAKAITMDRVSIERAAPYAAADAAVTLELASVLQPQLAELGLAKLFEEVELPLIEVLAGIEQHGVRLDTDYLSGFSQRLERSIGEVEEEIYRSVGESFNLNSPKQLAVILFEKLGLPVVKKTKTGASTDASVLEELAGSHAAVVSILEYRQLTKLKSTYVDAIPLLINPRTECVHTSFNQAVAATGRLSSSDPNLQNIPIRTELGREIRKTFLPSDPRNLILTADYSQIELRVLAHLSQDPAFLEAFRLEEDIHTATAAEIFGVKLEEVSSEMRRIAKTVNFGVVFGQGPFGLAKVLGIPQKQAKAFIEAFKKHYQGIDHFAIRTVAQTRRDGFVSTILGRRRALPEINSASRTARDFAERMAVNTPIQGSAADLIKVAMVNIGKKILAVNLKSRMILQVHDELIFEAPPEEIEELKKIVLTEMEGAIELTVPLRVSIGVGRNWGEAK